MAYASIGGFNPVLGLYAGMVPTTVGSLFARTVLMTTTLTSAIALTSQSVLHDAGLDPTDLHNVATLTVMVGVVMVLFGALRLGVGHELRLQRGDDRVHHGHRAADRRRGRVGRHRVRAGRAQHVGEDRPDPRARGRLGRPHDTGHRRDGRGVGGRARRTPAPGDGDPDRPARRERRGRRARARRGEGRGHRQHPEHVPGASPAGPVGRARTWSSGAVAVALVALAQAAGIGAAVPNPDGSRTNVSGDFMAQGVANLAGGFFRALPVGGSLSRTGVATSAGARTRWAGVFAGISLAVLVIVAGGAAEQIPMPVIGGLILVIGAELIVGRARRHRLRRRAPRCSRRWRWSRRSWPPPSSRCSRRSSSGSALSLLLYCAGAQRQTRLAGTDPPGRRTLAHRRGAAGAAEPGRHGAGLRGRQLLRRAVPTRGGVARSAGTRSTPS